MVVVMVIMVVVGLVEVLMLIVMVDVMVLAVLAQVAIGVVPVSEFSRTPLSSAEKCFKNVLNGVSYFFLSAFHYYRDFYFIFLSLSYFVLLSFVPFTSSYDPANKLCGGHFNPCVNVHLAFLESIYPCTLLILTHYKSLGEHARERNITHCRTFLLRVQVLTYWVVCFFHLCPN